MKFPYKNFQVKFNGPLPPVLFCLSVRSARSPVLVQTHSTFARRRLVPGPLLPAVVTATVSATVVTVVSCATLMLSGL